jgi:hypothetical protein
VIHKKLRREILSKRNCAEGIRKKSFEAWRQKTQERETASSQKTSALKAHLPLPHIKPELRVQIWETMLWTKLY